MIDVVLNFLTAKKIKDPEYGILFFELLTAHLPNAAPEFYGNNEPLTEHFDPRDLGKIGKTWMKDVSWTNKRPKSFGMLCHGNRYHHTSIDFYFDVKKCTLAECREFFKKVAVLFSVDLASIHLFKKNQKASQTEVF